MAANSWLESIYYMADYYFFEAQHIFKKKIEGKTGGKYRALVKIDVETVLELMGPRRFNQFVELHYEVR